MTPMQKAGCPTRAIAIVEAGPRETDAMGEAREFVARGKGTILVLGGRRGIGKTVAATWICSELIDPVYLRATDLMRAGLYDERLSGKWATWATLVVDDLGVEFSDRPGVMASILDDLVDRRYGSARSTVLVTNLRAGEFRERYGERLADRIREAGRFVELDGESMRGRP